MKRGEVYEYGVGSMVARIVIVSDDRYNPGRATYVRIITPGDGAAPMTLAVPITNPVRGTIDAARLRPLDPTAIRARLGRITATAQAQLDMAIAIYLGFE